MSVLRIKRHRFTSDARRRRPVAWDFLLGVDPKTKPNFFLHTKSTDPPFSLAPLLPSQTPNHYLHRRLSSSTTNWPPSARLLPKTAADPLSMAVSSPRLASMGMFIIDTFQFLDPTSGQDLGNKGLPDQIGGGGCYFAIGARVFLHPAEIQMVIDRGVDWRSQDQAVLDRFDLTPSGSCGSMWHYRSRPDGTTRAVNIYKGEHRGFDYLSRKIRLEPSDLLRLSPSVPPKYPEWIHLICSPQRAFEMISEMTISMISIRQNHSSSESKPRFPRLVYEPIPDSCVKENLPTCLEVMSRLAVFSPNHEEAAQLLGVGEEWEKVREGSEEAVIEFITDKLAGGFVKLMRDEAEAHGGRLLEPFGPIICIRSGAWGSIVGRGGFGFYHVPAWHTAAEGKRTKPDTSSSRIKDVTGAGNSFLGGFSAYLVQTEGDTSLDPIKRLKEAAVHGAVSASLVIEQLGLPEFEVRDGEELWNGHTAADRVQILQERLSLS